MTAQMNNLSFFTYFALDFCFLNQTQEVLESGSHQAISNADLLDWRVALDGSINNFPNFSFCILFCFVFPHDNPPFSGACNHKSALLLVLNVNDFVIGGTLVEHGQHVVFVLVQVPKTNHVLGRRGCQQAVSDPDRTQRLRVSCDRKFHLLLRRRLFVSC